MKLQGFFRICFLLLVNIICETSIYSQTFYYYTPSVLASQTISTTYNGSTITGEYLTILGNGHSQITKPFIIVEGFDPLNNQGFQDYINLYNNAMNSSSALLYNLYNNGYDVIILNFGNANNYIQNNAMLLVKLINDINTIKAEQKDNTVVMGFSMGGLVARYALTWMEANNQNHQTRLYISHDTPQKGANFPLGIQEFIQDFRNHTAVAWIAADIILNVFDIMYPAAKQMLIYHYSNSTNGQALPADEKKSFFRELYNLNPTNNGYPSIPVKIAISNGNYSGYGQALSAGDVLLNFDYWKNPHRCWETCTIFNLIGLGKCHKDGCEASDHITATIRAGFSQANPLEEFNVYTSGMQTIGNSNYKIPMGGSGKEYFSEANLPYDIAPGSITTNYINLLGKSINKTLGVTATTNSNACFIPTISALDLNLGLNDSFDLNASSCISIFDYIYANEYANTEHWTLASGAKDFIMNHLLATNEVPIHHSDVVLPTGKVIASNVTYPVIASGKIYNAGDFTLQSGSSVSLTSASSITLNPGFKMEAGSELKTSISTGICTDNIAYLPNYVSEMAALENSKDTITYNCNNYLQMPTYSNDSLYYLCTAPTNNSASISSMDSVLNANISIYPNPTSSNLTITIADAIINQVPTNYFSVKVLDVNSNAIYYSSALNTSSIDINVSACPIGLITIIFNINNGAYIYTRKVIKI